MGKKFGLNFDGVSELSEKLNVSPRAASNWE